MGNLADLAIDIQPLLDRVPEDWKMRALGRGCCSTDVSTWEQQMRRGRLHGFLSIYTADNLAVRLLGVHPAAIWGNLWYEVSGDQQPEFHRSFYAKQAAAARREAAAKQVATAE
jgi:hypothetical protein